MQGISNLLMNRRQYDQMHILELLDIHPLNNFIIFYVSFSTRHISKFKTSLIVLFKSLDHRVWRRKENKQFSALCNIPFQKVLFSQWAVKSVILISWKYHLWRSHIKRAVNLRVGSKWMSSEMEPQIILRWGDYRGQA